MRVSGPDTFELTFDEHRLTVGHPDGGRNFHGRATSPLPKLYVVTSGREIVYVGVTKQSISARLRLGWSANGETGYYGYAWRRHLRAASLHVWYHEDAREGDCLDIETVEAEIVFLIRRRGQWPLHQTEIHFHPSQAVHREQAARILKAVRKAAGAQATRLMLTTNRQPE